MFLRSVALLSARFVCLCCARFFLLIFVDSFHIFRQQNCDKNDKNKNKTMRARTHVCGKKNKTITHRATNTVKYRAINKIHGTPICNNSCTQRNVSWLEMKLELAPFMQTGLLDGSGEGNTRRLLWWEEKKKNRTELVLQATNAAYENIDALTHTLHVNPKPNYHNSTMVQYKLLPLFNQVLQSFYTRPLACARARALSPRVYIFAEDANRPLGAIDAKR